MRHLISTSIFLVTIVLRAMGQSPEIDWENTIGGDQKDQLYTIAQCADGGYIIGGYSESGVSGDKTSTDWENGFSEPTADYWVLRLDPFGNIIWQKRFGGDGSDHLEVVFQTSDGGYMLGGYSSSDVSGNKVDSSTGGQDYWIIKLTSTGAYDWDNAIGGGSTSELHSMQQTEDGGYILGGSSISNAYADKTEDNIGGRDYWVVKVDYAGNVEWDNTIGGYNDDFLFSIKQTNDKGYILGGFSSSTIYGDKTENPVCGGFENDYWVVKLNQFGAVEWDNTIGGCANDRAYEINQTSDGGYIVGGYSDSGMNGDKSENSWSDWEDVNDFWVIKLNSAGDILWQNTIGGVSDDRLKVVKQTNDGNYMVAGYTISSVGGDKTVTSEGGVDYWLILLDTVGAIIKQIDIGGTSSDYLYSAIETFDNGFLLGGFSYSNAGADKSEDNIGGALTNDYWIVKLKGDPCSYADETCNGIDDNCDGYIDEGLLFTEYYMDLDEDGFGNVDNFTLTCDGIPLGYISDSQDCNDNNELINPLAVEICNILDDNCNGLTDEDLIVNTFFADADNDTYGDSTIDTSGCFAILTGFVLDSNDCDDSNPLIYPSAEEICNAIDEDCDDIIDEDLVFFVYYLDADADNYGNLDIDSVSCLASLPMYVLDSTDCNDNNSFIFPGATELPNGVDDNCNGITDETETEVLNLTNNTFTIYPNPNNGTFTISDFAFVDPSFQIEIYNAIGQQIYIREIATTQNAIEVHLSNIASGIYIIKMNNGDNVKEQKLIIE